MSASPVLKLENLRKTYSSGWGTPPTPAVKGLSLEALPGEIFGFLGPNGAGKTTTIKMLLGFVKPTSGAAFLFGMPAHSLEPKKRIGFLSENPSFYNFLNGYQTLLYFGRLFGLKGKTLAARIDRLAENLNLDLELRLPLSKLSKGMLQRVGLAQALVNDPDLLILDEPMSGLDPLGRREFRQILLRLKSEGKTIFFSSHILSDIETLCDRTAILAKGTLRGLFSMREFMENERVWGTAIVEGPAAAEAARQLPSGVETSPDGPLVKLTARGAGDWRAVKETARRLGWRVVAEEEKNLSLEDYFVSLAAPKKEDA